MLKSNFGPIVRLRFICIAMIGGCTSATEPLSAKSYPLERYNGASLPIDLGELGPKGSGSSSCHFFITGGRLSISNPNSFSYTYDIRNGCTQALMSQPGLQGTYEQRGSEITFTVTRVDGMITTYGGLVSQSRIVFRSPDEVLEFANGR
jgi:hypothetical protein